MLRLVILVPGTVEALDVLDALPTVEDRMAVLVDERRLGRVELGVHGVASPITDRQPADCRRRPPRWVAARRTDRASGGRRCSAYALCRVRCAGQRTPRGRQRGRASPARTR